MHVHFGFCRCQFVVSLLAIVLFGALSATNAAAGTVAFTPNGVVDEVGAIGPVNLGIVFTANANFSVDALGFYFLSDLTGPEPVGLYNSSGTLLTSATVLLSDPQVNGYLFHSITPLTLTAGNQYTVDAYIGSNTVAVGSIAPNHAAEVTFGYDDYVYPSQNGIYALAFPYDTSGANAAYYGPNFDIASTTVPETSSLLLLGSGALGLAGFIRRKMNL